MWRQGMDQNEQKSRFGSSIFKIGGAFGVGDNEHPSAQNFITLYNFSFDKRGRPEVL
jgi:hypothetical protein